MATVYVIGAIVTLIVTALVFARIEAESWDGIEFSEIAMGCLAGVMTGLLWPLTLILLALAGMIYLIVKKLVPFIISLFEKEDK